MKTALALRHLSFEDLGLLEPWFVVRGWQVRYLDIGVDRLVESELNAAGLMVVLGGPIGAEDDEHYPFLQEEEALIRRRLLRQEPLLGICLGAQLMARALGARVKPMPTKEIGYAPISLTAAGRGSPLQGLGSQPVLHWHGDQFDMPGGLETLASTPMCAHQSFMVGSRAMAWQFHLEVDAARIEQWLIGHSMELSQAGVSTDQLREASRTNDSVLKLALDGVMTHWFAKMELR